MSKKQMEAIELIRNFTPQEFGIKKAYYKIQKDELELLFFVEESKMASLIGYIKSLSSLLEKKLDGVTVKSSIYIYKDKAKVDKVAKDNDLEKFDLVKKLKFSPSC